MWCDGWVSACLILIINPQSFTAGHRPLMTPISSSTSRQLVSDHRGPASGPACSGLCISQFVASRTYLFVLSAECLSTHIQTINCCLLPENPFANDHWTHVVCNFCQWQIIRIPATCRFKSTLKNVSQVGLASRIYLFIRMTLSAPGRPYNLVLYPGYSNFCIQWMA